MHILVTQVMDVPERDTSQDKQFSKEKDVPAVSLGHPQGALVHQNRDVKHQASSRGEMIGGEMVGAEMVGAEMVGGEMVGGEMVGGEMVGEEMVGAEMVGGEMVVHQNRDTEHQAMVGTTVLIYSTNNYITFPPTV